MEQIVGGIIIGLSATMMLLFNGRVTGISGILSGLINKLNADSFWRFFFIFGLMLGGLVLKFIYPEAFTLISTAAPIDYVIAGFLVGFGTLLGSGCTSGHGVCGISRFSTRSIIATLTFITSGVVGVLLFKLLKGGL